METLFLVAAGLAVYHYAGKLNKRFRLRIEKRSA